MTRPGGALVADIDRESRRSLVKGQATLEGIDVVEVVANRPGLPTHVEDAPVQRTLLVHLLNGAVPENWDASRVAVLGGVRVDVRVNPVDVEWAYPAVDVAAESPRATGVPEADRVLIRNAIAEGDRSKVFAVRTTSSGDWSTYVLRLLGPGGHGVPDGFDEPLAQAPFSFTVDCPSPLDCRLEEACPPGNLTSPVLDYLARDYEALRSRLLDRLSTVLPWWKDRSSADTGVMLVELFAYLGDRLAYWQDAVAEEAYLGTSRRRTSVRRHARLLNYPVHEGCSARTWLAFTTAASIDLAAGTPIADLAPDGARPVDSVAAGGVVFETRQEVHLVSVRDAIPLHAWGDPDHCLPTGTTSAFLAAPATLVIARGDVLILCDRPPKGVRDGDPTRRFAVRLDREPVTHTDALAPETMVLEVHWHPEDALPLPLQVTRRGSAAPVAVALANVVLADHGASVAREELDPPQVPEEGRYLPRLRRTGLAWAEPVKEADWLPTPDGMVRSAASFLSPDPRRAVAQVELDDEQRRWGAQPDLLASGRLDPHFVVEPEPDGVARLRFGDGLTGREPAGGSDPRAWYRLGGGSLGNVGAGRLTRLLTPDGRAAVDPDAKVTVWNPLPAIGGTDPEPLEQVRQLAPHAFRQQLRAVTSPDYAAVAMREPGVQRAVARRRWTGSWYTQEVIVDPIAARADDQGVPLAVAAALEVRRMAGVDVKLAPPAYVPLHIVLTGCVAQGYLRADVQRQMLDALSARTLPNGRPGFFHPDAFTFGQPLFLSDLVAAAMGVAGLAWIDVETFARRGGTPLDTVDALAAGQLVAAAREVLRCDSDPSNPEAGHVEVVLRGGS